MPPLEFTLDVLDNCDLVQGATYLSGNGSLGDEPINRLLQCGNQGGIRVRGKTSAPALVALYTTFEDTDWPDTLDSRTGRLTYFGDNKDPGRELHDTHKGGNLVLRQAFGALHVRPDGRAEIPPFFVFSKVGRSRDVRFDGLAAPGAPDASETEDLVAIWKTTGRMRFQNYRAIFTLLDAPLIARTWVGDIVAGRDRLGPNAPDAWRAFVAGGTYRSLRND